MTGVKELRVALTDGDLRETLARYHFCREDFDALQAAYRMLQPLLEIKAYYRWKKAGEQIRYPEYAVVFLTLGSGVDALQEVYLDRGCLSEAYRVECVAMDLLEKAYAEFIRQIQAESGKWIQKMDFLGDTYPVEWLPELYRDFEGIDITYNEKFVLSPGKSVVFLLPVSKERTEKPCRLCGGCPNTDCVLRREAPEKLHSVF